MEESSNLPGYLINVQKQSTLTGEVIQVSSNLPVGSLSEDIRKEIDKITQAIDWRIPQPTAEAELAELIKKQPGKSVV